MDPTFLFAGVRLDKKRFNADLSRFQVLGSIRINHKFIADDASRE